MSSLSEESRSPKRILIVEDHDSVRSLLKAVLGRENFSIDEAENGREAIEKISENEYDVIVLDLMMPVVSGYRVLDYLKAQKRRTRCIVVSAAGEIGRATIDPSITILKKPFDTAELRRIVLEAAANPTPQL